MTVTGAKQLLLTGVLCLSFCLVVPWSLQAAKMLETLSIAQITKDEEGGALAYPSGVFFDPQQEELYVVNGGSGRIIVYGSDYFPRWSIGAGRGVLTPRSVRVLPDGRVVAVQIPNRVNPVAKITILNAAYFPEMEIPLNDIPGVEGFIPHNVAFSSDGLIYVSGELYRGVLVFDQEGDYLRTLQPTDSVESLSFDYKPEKGDSETGSSEAAAATEGETGVFANIPEEFRPRTRDDRITTGGKAAVGPVKVNYVQIDSKGRLYLISPETGKIYVYAADESFLFAFGTKGGSPGQLSNPRSLVIDEERGLLYVADYMRHSVLGYDLNGNYLFDTGGRGYAPGWYNFPNDLALNSRGELIVADLFNKRVQVLDVNYDKSFYSLDEILAAKKPAQPPKSEEESASEEESGTSVDAESVEPEAVSDGQKEPLLIPGGGSAEEAVDEIAEPVDVEVLPETEIPTIPE